MKHENGFQLDVVQNDNVTRDQALIRMNVDDFDEAFELLTAHGFKNRHDNITETGSSRSAVMVSPTGYEIALIKHVRKENTWYIKALEAGYQPDDEDRANMTALFGDNGYEKYIKEGSN